ncbi:MAG: class I SAM-dependent methyltransferase [Betaproteobacteria bacterium]|nr:class I SAM-dependent methyltransferase [Betaproteobacteria bacterium]
MEKPIARPAWLSYDTPVHQPPEVRMEQKFKVGICVFSYGGNGGISSEVPDIREWATALVADVASDDRISDVRMWTLSDTPITMTRNRAVLQARQHGIDVLVMVDSDMKPDVDFGTSPDAKKFFQSSFDFLVKNYHRGPCVIGVPYCGPPPHECVYVFRWNSMQSGHPNPDFQLEMYDRHTAVKMAGIQECAALPTGLIMYDMRAFELTEPKKQGDHPWFYYEWRDHFAADKASTEDVTNTRDLSLVGTQKLGYNPVFCNWDAWAGHWKPKCVGKPAFIDAANICSKLKESWESGYEAGVKIVDLQPAAKFPEPINSVPAQWSAPPTQDFDSMGMDLPLADEHGIRLMLDAAFASRMPGMKRIVEVGSWAGRSAIIMAKHMETNYIKDPLHDFVRIACVDTWRGNRGDSGCDAVKDPDEAYKTFMRNTAKWRLDPVKIIGYPSDSITASKTLGWTNLDDWQRHGRIVDLVYIDAEHDYYSVVADIKAWLDVKPRFIGGHDYGMESVRKAVSDCGLVPEVCGNVWWCRLDE